MYIVTSDQKYTFTHLVIQPCIVFCQDVMITSNSVPNENLHSNATLLLLSQHPPPASDVPSGIVINACTIHLANESSCSLSVPMSQFEYYALMALYKSNSFPYDRADVSIKCQPRGWLYAIIVISLLVGIVACIAVLVAICCRAAKRRRPMHSTHLPVRNLSEPKPTSRRVPKDSEPNEETPMISREMLALSPCCLPSTTVQSSLSVCWPWI